ncbi:MULTISPECIES: T9SS type A sorting domain-containing protein [Aequorivita]|uniref:T9SS type A sorting domain-containing protein n=3 Tax=Aequorivita TaxID=153265 RepID=A0AB35YUT0_9FLAO|nr:T9SS type A sorting domain-containing protein [Aequorivita sp. Ant34-E75]WGF93355.1 T9SS type A sorting domain-containing protein [Aequorivita sp. Ant34-E75]
MILKKLLVFITLLSSFICFAQYTAIPDSNFENHLEQNGMGDGIPNNGLVLTANIENVDTLLVNSRGIHDLTGIEDFAALELLNCAYNIIPVLDVSQNMNLWGLNCESSSVTELILPPTSTLEIINCPENNLTELDVSHNPGLVQLYCFFNYLTSLNLTNNTVLDLVFADHNEITGFLNTSQNLALTSLSVSYNDIAELDLTTNIALHSLGASSNPILSLDARNGNNEDIVSFVVTETTGELDCILVDDANASYLDDWLVDPYITFVNNQAECDALGVAEATLEDFTMYPNPATSTLAINLPNHGFEGLVVTVANNLGQVLESKELLENTAVVPLDVSGYAAGVYFVTLKAGNDVTTKKLVVQ